MTTTRAPLKATRKVPENGSSRLLGAGVALTLGGLLLLVLATVRSVDLDMFHEMALIREALALGRLPLTDTFAYTSSVEPVVHHEWGVGAILYALTVQLGLGGTGLVLLRLALIGTVAAACIAVARLRGADWTAIALCAPLAIFLTWPGLSPVRAHLFTFAFTAILLLILELERRGHTRALLAWPVLFVVWLNLHGGVVVGVGLLGLYTLERLVRTFREKRSLEEALRAHALLLAVAASSAPLFLVNPYGWAYIPYLVDALLLDRPLMPEWWPLWAEPFRGGPLLLFLASVAVAGYALVRGDRSRSRFGLLLLAAGALFAVRSVRGLPIYALLWLAIIPPLLRGTPLVAMVRGAAVRRARAIGTVGVALGVLLIARATMIGAFSVIVPVEPGDPGNQLYPAGAVQYLDEVGFEGNLMTPFGVGAYVSWHLWPQVRVGMDSRYEVAFDPDLVVEAQRIYGGTGDWRAFLERFPTDAVLVAFDAPMHDSIMARVDAGGPGVWAPRYRDDAYVIFAPPGSWDRLPQVDRRGERIVGSFP